MKMVALLVVLSFALVSGSARGEEDIVAAYVPVPAKESYSIGAFKPSKTEYNFKHYDAGKAVAFLASVNNRFSDGDVVAVDGLKWQRTAGEWKPIPNPPVPVFKKGDDVNEHARKYAEWIDNHPHFGYPALPVDKKK